METNKSPTMELHCDQIDGGVELLDPGLGSWVMRLSPTTATPASSGRLLSSSVAAVGAVAQAFTPVGTVISMAADAGQSMQVAFSSATQSGIASGTLRLMSGSPGVLPVAVDSAGRIRELAHVVPAAGVLTGPAILPVLLPAAAAAAASYYQHQALQSTLDGIREVVDRIEGRLRDDDWAVLEAGDDLARTLVQTDGSWEVPDQLRMELAIARQAVDRVFRSRRRFAHHLVRKLDEDTVGRQDPWTDQVRKLVKGDHNWIEVSLFLQAMVVRARLTAATAFVLATDGDAQASVALAHSAATELAASYDPLLKALEPLAGRRPDGGLLDRIPGRRSSDEDRFRFVGSLVSEMCSGIGEALDAVKEDTTLVIPAHQVKALHTALNAA